PLLGLGVCSVRFAYLTAHPLTAVRLFALIAATGTFPPLHRRGAFVRTDARLYTIRFFLTFQRCESGSRGLFVRFHVLSIQLPEIALVQIVQLALQVLTALAQLVGDRVIDAVFFAFGFPRLGQVRVD